MRAVIISVSLACSGHETVEFQILNDMKRKSSGVHTLSEEQTWTYWQRDPVAGISEGQRNSRKLAGL